MKTVKDCTDKSCVFCVLIRSGIQFKTVCCLFECKKLDRDSVYFFSRGMIMELKKCEVCGKSFEFDHTRRKYCSKECFKKGICAMKKEWRKEHLPYQPKVIYCQICGKPVEAELGAVSISRPKMHEICIINDIVDTIKQGKKLSGTQINRKARLGLTKDEIMEYVNAN